MPVQQVFFKVIWPVKLSSFMRTVTPRKRTHKPGGLFMSPHVSGEVPHKLLAADWTFVSFVARPSLAVALGSERMRLMLVRGGMRCGMQRKWHGGLW